MSIDSLHRQLACVARQRVHSGELTERGLARLCGVSQPHMHNVLKGIRSLSTLSADRLMDALKLSVGELVWQSSVHTERGVRAVPVLGNRLGPGTHAAFTQLSGFAPFSSTLTAALVDPVAARLAPDLLLPRLLAANDLVLLDQNPALRETPGRDTCWVVSEGSGLRVRYIRIEHERIWIANESSVRNPELWRSIPVTGRNVLDVIKARIVWVGREFSGG